MAKFCGKCGAKVEENEKFCPHCGARIQGSGLTRTKSDGKQMGSGVSAGSGLPDMTKKVILCACAALVVAVGAGAGFYYHMQSKNDAVQPPASTTAAPVASSPSQEAPTKDSLAQANDLLKSKGFPSMVSAVSNVDDSGFLGFTRDKGLSLIVYDKKDDVIATVDYNRKLLNLKQNKTGNSYDPVILRLHIKDDKASRDSKLGFWSNGTHTFPIYSLYDVDAQGTVVPGMLTSAPGSNPSRYHSYLNEQQNVNIANLALTHADSLREDMQSRHIALP